MNIKFLLLTLALVTAYNNVFSQLFSPLVYDTSHCDIRLNNARYYGKTDFSVVDTLSYWRYYLDTTYKGSEQALVKPIGRLAFWRSKQVNDSFYYQVYNRAWVPNIVFNIYSINDTAFCYQEAAKVRVFSSCVPPGVGGDLLVVGKFILLNNNVCVQCAQSSTQVDYCRPVLQAIFSKIDVSRVASLATLLQQLMIPEGDLKQLEK